jgi:hypothetical protein
MAERGCRCRRARGPGSLFVGSLRADGDSGRHSATPAALVCGIAKGLGLSPATVRKWTDSSHARQAPPARGSARRR